MHIVSHSPCTRPARTRRRSRKAPAGVTGTTPAATCAQAARQYDSAGRMTGNEFAAYGFDAASRINAITQNLYASLVTSSTATGTLTSSTSYYATPVSWSVGYDSRSRITGFNRITNPAGSNATASAAGNAQASFSYDPNSNRLTSINKVTSDTDLDGDFDQFDKASTTAQTLAIGAGTNKLLGFSQTLTSTKGTKTLSTSSQQVNYSLDAAGNLTSDGLRTFAYDATNRHSQTTVSKDGEASKITYLHNALGQRVFKSEPQTGQTLPNETVLGTSFTDWLKKNFSWLYATAQTNATLGNSYVYADGQLPEYALLGEYGNGGTSSTGRTEYLWLPTDSGQAIPVGLFRSNRFYAVHADHLNTPRLINDDSNKAVWQWPYSAFGDNPPVGILKATTNPANAYTQDPASNARLQATGAAITYNMRFAGQYADSETGLFFNGFRSYLSSQGRYSQSDPAGLGGGWSRFGYAEGDPLGNTDPFGLWTYNQNDVRGGFDTDGKSLVFNPKYYDPNAAAEILLIGATSALGGAGGLMCAAKTTRETAKALVFSERTAPELKVILGWGNGAEGVKIARGALNSASVLRIQGTMTKAEIQAVESLYRAAAAAGRGGPVAPERAAYMAEILRLWK
jgi:RHS repeat-associated protein